MKKLAYSFSKGLEKIPLGQQECVKKSLYDILDVKNRHAFCRKKSSIHNIPKQQYDAITSLFAEFGVIESDVWTVTECQKN